MQLRYFPRPLRNADAAGERGDESAYERRHAPSSLLASQPPVEPDAPAPAPLRAPGARQKARPERNLAPSFPDPNPAAPDPRAILDSIGQTVYDWDLETDSIHWGPNAEALFGFDAAAAFGVGRAYAECLSPESENTPYDAIMRSDAVDGGAGVSFQISYGVLRPDKPREATIWVEDTGRWFAGPNGRPARAHGLIRIITDRYRQDRQLAFKSRFDLLTGALNRASLLEQTAIFFAAAAKRKQTFAALLVGVDNLFMLNRTYGYDVADQVIAGLAKRLRANCRERDLLARYAGNKLALVLENCEADETAVVAERLIEIVASTPFETSAGPVPVALRVGAAVAPRNGRAAHVLFQHAEEALDLARQPGAARFIAYEPSLAREDSRMRTLKISDEIVSALSEDRILIALQPLVRATTREPALYEALMRLRRADGSLAAPAAVLPTAEKSGLIQMIDQRVLELALRKLAECPDIRIAVNVSGQTLREPDFFSRLRALLDPNRELARRLTIELTETCAIEDVEATILAVATIKQFGAKVAMDDFGAGHTSFKNLRRLDFDLVKIDGAFVQNMSRSADDRFFVRTLIDLARHVGIPVVAEWVEDEQTADILRDWGVDYLQGDYFAAATVTVGCSPCAGDRGAA
ncbi:MAG TPA: bifunctional diguanylate cyclase/phosphodiesterase [Rhodoblastus sp.]|nr:bifunctional diguanylate cyclase/phosphodiesterase [Rhodoblastus sp.]